MQANGETRPSKPLPPQLQELPQGIDLMHHVAACLRMGCDPIDVRKQLLTFGFTEVNADKVIADTAEWMQRNPYAGQPMPAGPLYWAVSHSGLVIGVLCCLAGIVAFTWPVSADDQTQAYAFGGAAILFGGFAVFWDVYVRVVR